MLGDNQMMCDNRKRSGEDAMYQIALCDDETTELHTMEQMLRSYPRHSIKNTLSIRQFEGADRLLLAVEQESYAPDLIFLDIYMPTLSGLEAAKKLSEMNLPCQIVFLTSSRDHALEAFELNVLHYLVKPVSEESLFAALDRAFAQFEKDPSRYLFFQTGNRLRRIAADDIVYCEAQRKTQCIYLKTGEQLTLHTTMSRLYEMLAAHREFAKAGMSYIINLKHIGRLGSQTLQFDNGKEIYLPRGSYKSLSDQYFNHYFGPEMGGD